MEESTREYARLAKRLIATIKKINVEVPLFLYMTASFLHGSIIQAFLSQKSCYTLFGAYLSPVDNCSNSTLIHDNLSVQTLTSHMALVCNICQLLISIPVTILLGAYADNNNRKRAMMVPFVGVILADFNYIVQSSVNNSDVRLVPISDLLFGLTGGFPAVLSGLFSYASAESYTKNTAFNVGRRMSLMEGTVGLGSILGFAISFFFGSQITFRTIFIINCGLHIAALTYIVLFIRQNPENESADESTSILDWRENYSCTKVVWFYLGKMFTMACRPRPNFARRIIWIVLFSFSISHLIFGGLIDVSYLYLHLKLNWSWITYSYYLGLSYAIGAAAVLFVYPYVKRCLSDYSVSIIGVLSRAAAAMVLIFPINTPFVFVGSALYMFYRFSSVGMRSIISQQVLANEQGQAFALIALAEAVFFLLASAIFNAIYPWSLTFLNQLCFILMVVLAIFPVVALLYVRQLLHSVRHAQHSVLEDEDATQEP